MKIKTLNQDVINKIAAGEVIIEPASIVKELVENSIDAGSTRIDIQVKDGGKKEIIISDNGTGINYNDIPLAFRRHATSKINLLEDLEKLDTMGFRGEALSSIAAVSKVSIITKARDEELGSQSIFKDGHFVEQHICSFEEGTTVIVTDLFENVPARLKFLKNDKLEEEHVRDIVEKLALSHPGIRFSYTSNDQKIFQTPGNDSLKDTAYVIFGSNFSKHLTYFHTENLPMKIYGLIGDLDARRSYRDNQIFFLNGRYIKSPLLSQAYEEEWAGKLMKHQYPSGIIFVELPPYMIDVNVHPQKIEVEILNKTLITLLFKQCIRQVLEELDLVPRFIENEEEYSIKEYIDIPDEEEFTYEPVKLPQAVPVESSPELIKKEKEPEEVSEQPIVEKPREKLMLNEFRIIGVLFNTYILLEDNNILYIIDQHAAHEAVLFEEFYKVINSDRKFISQEILPKVLDVTNKELDTFEEVKEKIGKYGFSAKVQNGKLEVTAVPVIINIIQPPELLISVMNYLSSPSEIEPDPGLSKIVSMSCKAAVKAGNIMDKAEIRTLMENLSKLSNPYTCPHGRPVIQKRSQYEFEKLFKRVV